MTAYPVCETTYDDKTATYENGTEDYDAAVEYDQGLRGYDTGNDSSQSLNYDAVTKTIYDPVVTMGCPQCGNLLYNK